MIFVRNEMLGKIAWSFSAFFFRAIVPIFSFVVLARTLDKSVFGEYVYFVSISVLVSHLVEYGYNLTASRDMASHWVAKETVSIYVESGKLLLCSLFLAIIGFCFFAGFSELRMFLAVMVGMVVGLIPYYDYIGNQDYRKLFVIESFFSIVQTAGLIVISIFLGDVLSLLLFFLLCKLMFLAVSRAERGILFIRCDTVSGITSLRKGFFTFLYRLSVYGYTSFNTLAIGWMMGPLAIAKFSPSEKLVTGATGCITPVTQVVLARSTRRRKQGDGPLSKTDKKVASVIFLISVVATCLVSFFSENIIGIFFGSDFKKYSWVLSFLIFLVPVKFCSGILGSAYFLPNGEEDCLAKIIISCSVVHLIFLTIMISFCGLLGAVVASVFTEFLIAIVLYLVARRRRIL